MKKLSMIMMFVVVLLWVSEALAAMDIFVSLAPQKWLVKRIGGEGVTVSTMIRPGQDPHTFEPHPRQVTALSRARIWYLMGVEFEEQLRPRVESVAPKLEIIDMARGVDKIPMVDAEHDHHHDHQGDHHQEEDTGLDPHIWLSPANLEMMGKEVASTLAEVDPAGKEKYWRNYSELAAEMEDLDQQIRTRLAPYKGASFFVYHPSFGYFADSYGLVQEPVEVGGKSPGPRQLGALIGKARKENIKVIFVQPQFDSKAAQAIAAAIGGNVVPLDALAEDVPANLRVMAEKIEDALHK